MVETLYFLPENQTQNGFKQYDIVDNQKFTSSMLGPNTRHEKSMK